MYIHNIHTFNITHEHVNFFTRAFGTRHDCFMTVDHTLTSWKYIKASVAICFDIQQTRYKVLNKDQWYNVLEFSRLIKPDLSNYDEDGACEYLSFTKKYTVCADQHGSCVTVNTLRLN